MDCFENLERVFNFMDILGAPVRDVCSPDDILDGEDQAIFKVRGCGCGCVAALALRVAPRCYSLLFALIL